jgi:hypothetical protein
MVTSAEFPPRNQPLLSVKRTPPAAGVGVETAARRRRSLAPELVWTSGRLLGWRPADLAARLHTERVTAQEMMEILEQGCEARLANATTGSRTAR